MRDRFAFDHTSIGVDDLSGWASTVRRELGGFVVTGQHLEQFSYLLFHLGQPPTGGGLELIAPRGQGGFMRRFLRSRGPGFHHLTFTVPDVEAAADAVEGLGLRIHSRQLVHAPWREAFIQPDGVHGALIQLADSSQPFPPLGELAATTERDVAAWPHNAGGSTDQFWTEVWQVQPRRETTVLRTHLATSDPGLSRALFADVLRGEHHREVGQDVYSWGPGADLTVSVGHPGIRAMTLVAPGWEGMSIGRAVLRPG